MSDVLGLPRMRRRVTVAVRYCERCAGPIPKGHGDGAARYASRRFCGRTCYELSAVAVAPVRAQRSVRTHRIDALPEHANYADTGCDAHPACLTCPLEVCVFDRYHDRRVEATHRQAVEAARLRDQGLSAAAIAGELGVSKRTVCRYLAVAADEPAAPRERRVAG